ncbi:CPBP family intramembrane glutamic endopeptidase [Azotobacter salinestris]|uniref:CPBP family intramembrane glutamic endopeptidase n=1 Tax=Azotobacter salinestris TaxID=69964 RepID=UPI001FCA704D|nr:CPBP family intramembrane glutamic endopeptidase [Azotobacter salinestris]
MPGDLSTPDLSRARTAPSRYRLLPPVLVLLAGSLAGGIQPAGLLAGSLFVAWIFHARPYLAEGPWRAGALLASLALAAHLLPGFTPLWLAEPRQLSPDAPAYGVRLSWDKLLLGATLLGWWWTETTTRARARAWPYRAWACALATLLGVPLLALAMGLVAWQPKWPAELPVWLAVNFGVTVLAEELLFRGLLQDVLVQRLGTALGITLSATLFGLAHAPFSLPFALLAGVAGLGYGGVMQLSGRLATAVLLHGAINLLHFLLLSYPLRLN